MILATHAATTGGTGTVPASSSAIDRIDRMDNPR